MGRRPVFDAAAAADLRRRYEAGATLTVLATETGCDVGAVRRALLRAGTVMRPRNCFTSSQGRAAAAAANVVRTSRALARGRDIVRRRLAGDKWVVIAADLGSDLGTGSSLLGCARRALIADNADDATWAAVFPRAARHRRTIQKQEVA